MCHLPAEWLSQAGSSIINCKGVCCNLSGIGKQEAPGATRAAGREHLSLRLKSWTSFSFKLMLSAHA